MALTSASVGQVWSAMVRYGWHKLPGAGETTRSPHLVGGC